jgi:hypothetical protein
LGSGFANATTVYIADEGVGYTGGTDLYTHAAAQTTAGLKKWVFNSTTNTWNLANTLQTGLLLGAAYNIRNYPTGNNPATGLPWAPAADGLRNITGTAVWGGYAAIWAITSTVSGMVTLARILINSCWCSIRCRTQTPPSPRMKVSSPFAKLVLGRCCAAFPLRQDADFDKSDS